MGAPGSTFSVTWHQRGTFVAVERMDREERREWLEGRARELRALWEEAW